MSAPASLPYVVCDVFTQRPFGGNPLAVVLGAEVLDGGQMRTLAREFNLSETVFVLPPQDPTCDHRLRIFTPAAELEFAGHPTVGAALVLAARMDDPPERLRLEEGVGCIEVTLRDDPSGYRHARLQAAAPFSEEESGLDLAATAALLGLSREAVLAPATIVSAGTPFAFIPLRDAAALAAARYHRPSDAQLEAAPALGQVFCFTGDPASTTPLRARMFGPGLGIIEDPATGSAATALAGWLALGRGSPGAHRWTLHQGIEMGRPSELELFATFDAGAVTSMGVEGSAVEVASGHIRVPGRALDLDRA